MSKNDESTDRHAYNSTMVRHEELREPVPGQYRSSSSGAKWELVISHIQIKSMMLQLDESDGLRWGAF
jgi:hypothetical protein